MTSATGQEQQTSAWPTTEASRKNLGRTWLEGRITESRQVGVDRENMPIFETILMTPAADKYSYPNRFCITSRSRLGRDGEDLSIEWKSSVGRGVTGALALSAFFVGSLRNGAGIVPYPSVKRERGAPFPFRVQGGASKRVGQLRNQILNESRMGEYSAQTPLCRGMHPSGIIHTSP